MPAAIFTGTAQFFPSGGDLKRSTVAETELGSRAYDSADREYTYIKAGATIAANDACKFNGSALGFDDVRPTAAAEEVVIGVATAAFALADFGYIVSRGRVTCKCVNGIAAGSSLSTNSTAGTLKIAIAGDLAQSNAVALVTGVTAGSAVYLS